MILPKKGLYAITQTANKSIDTVIHDVSEALIGGINILQYRDKQAIDAPFFSGALKELCHQYNIPFIINDNIALAKYIGADGVHLGKNDQKLSYARAQLGSQAIIGVSCYNHLELAQHAINHSADYVAFGRFFNSNSKPDATLAELSTLQAAHQQLNRPIVAIGGILPENGAPLIDAGADFLAVIDGLFKSSPRQSAQAYQALFTTK